MPKIQSQELNDLIENEQVSEAGYLEDEDYYDEDEEAKDVEYMPRDYTFNPKVFSGDELEEGMSYSLHKYNSRSMLDINELMEKGIVFLGDRIDLSNFPETVTVQAATQEQLDMIDPNSALQIKSVHLSNNTPVGWSEDYNYHNYQKMDEKIDLSAFENLESVETHFYLNDDLEEIKFPSTVKNMRFHHSKLPNLVLGERESVDEITANHVEMSNLPSKSLVIWSIIDGSYVDGEDEFDRYFDKKELEKRFKNIQNADGTYRFEDDGKVLLDNQSKPVEIEKSYSSQGWYNTYGVQGYEEFVVNGKDCLLTDNKFYTVASKRDVDGIDLVMLSNIDNPKDKFETVELFHYSREGMGGTIDFDEGSLEISHRYDAGRGYSDHSSAVFAVKDGKIVTESMVTSRNQLEYSALCLYKEFFKNAQAKKLKLSPEEVKAKNKMLEGYIYNWGEYSTGYFNNAKEDIEAFKVVKKAIPDEQKKAYIMRFFRDCKDKDALIVGYDEIGELIKSGVISCGEALKVPLITKHSKCREAIKEQIGNFQVDTKKILAEFAKESIYESNHNIEVSNLGFIVESAQQSGHDLSDIERLPAAIYFSKLPDKQCAAVLKNLFAGGFKSDKEDVVSGENSIVKRMKAGDFSSAEYFGSNLTNPMANILAAEHDRRQESDLVLLDNISNNNKAYKLADVLQRRIYDPENNDYEALKFLISNAPIKENAWVVNAAIHGNKPECIDLLLRRGTAVNAETIHDMVGEVSGTSFSNQKMDKHFKCAYLSLLNNIEIPDYKDRDIVRNLSLQYAEDLKSYRNPMIVSGVVKAAPQTTFEKELKARGVDDAQIVKEAWERRRAHNK